jgi:hypothetical protein
VLPLWKYTVPVHAALPFLIWWMGHAQEGALSLLWLGIHAIFPFALVLSWPWWRGQGVDMAILVVANHLVTFAVGIGLIALVG